MPTQKKSLKFGTELFEYELSVRRANRRLRISIHRDGRVVVSAPRFLARRQIDDFLAAKMDWIVAKREYFKTLPAVPDPGRSNADYLTNRDRARDLVLERLAVLNAKYGFIFSKIFIRNQKTRWGSCSGRKNLSFNYRILFLPSKLADYLIVHELCHLQEMNHSSRFWKLVEKTMPDHAVLRRELKNTGLSLE